MRRCIDNIFHPFFWNAPFDEANGRRCPDEKPQLAAALRDHLANRAADHSL